MEPPDFDFVETRSPQVGHTVDDIHPALPIPVIRYFVRVYHNSQLLRVLQVMQDLSLSSEVTTLSPKDQALRFQNHSSTRRVREYFA